MTFKRSVILALLLGVGGAAFRTVIWRSAYNSETRLITQPRLLLMFNLFLCLCALVVTLVFLLRWPRGAQAETPLTSAGQPEQLLRWGAGGCYAAAGIVLLLTLPRFSVVLLISGVFQLLQLPFLVLLILWRRAKPLTYATLTLLPTFANCCLVVGLYHQVGAEPNPQVYLWAVVSELLVALSWVALAGFGFQYQSGRWFGFCAHLALLTLPVGIIAPLPLPWRLSLLAQLLWLTGALLGLRADTEQPVSDEETSVLNAEEFVIPPEPPKPHPSPEKHIPTLMIPEDETFSQHNPQRLRKE